MKKTLLQTVCALVAGLTLQGCDKESTEMTVYEVTRDLSAFEKDGNKTEMKYNNFGVYQYRFYNSGSTASTIDVTYGSSTIVVNYNNLTHQIELDNTKGGKRVKTLTALSGHSLFYSIEYHYTAEGRLDYATYDGEGVNGQGSVNFYYDGNAIRIMDWCFDKGKEYVINLSDEENTGFVCHVFDFIGAPKVVEHILNPILYYLNVLGTPISKLPADVDIQRDGAKVKSVGNCSYSY